MDHKFLSQTLVALLLLLSITGCAYQHTIKPEDPVSSGAVYPLTQLFVRPPSNAMVSTRYAGILHEFRQQLIAREKFAGFTKSKNTPYKIYVEYLIDDLRSHPQMLWWTFTAFSLFIIPSQLEEKHNMAVSVYAGDKLIKVYEYEDIVTGWNSLLYMSDEYRKDTHNMIIDKLLNDMERDKIFPDINEPVEDRNKLKV